MTGPNTKEIAKIIDAMQSTLVELFDQLRTLRQVLNQLDIAIADKSPSSDVPLFSEVSKTHEGAHFPDSAPTTPGNPTTSSVSKPTDRVTSDNPSTDDTSSRSSPSVYPPSVGAPLPDARVARVLDPIAHELRTSDPPAYLLAEYLESAKDYLITDEHPNERVARDIDVVLKFLRARGRKGIRPDERTNILRRLARWKVLLSSAGSM